MKECPFEMSKLAQYLVVMGVPFSFNRHRGGLQIRVKTESMDWDAICNDLSYGHEVGLLEIMGSIVSEEIIDDEVEGWLTAEEIADRVIKTLEAN